MPCNYRKMNRQSNPPATTRNIGSPKMAGVARKIGKMPKKPSMI